MGLVSRLVVEVSAGVDSAAANLDASRESQPIAGGGGDGSGGVGCDGKPPDPFRGGFLHLECEPAPVPPPSVVETAAPVVAAFTSASTVPSAPQPLPLPPLLPLPARPRPERAFFWEPRSSVRGVRGDVNKEEGAEGGEETGGSGSGAGASVAVEGFLPMVVGSDGQPVDGIPLTLSPPTPPSEEDEGARAIEVPVWVRSETGGRVAIRARVVYGLEGRSMAAAVSELRGAAASPAAGEGVSATEWACAEVMCIRPISAAVDVVPLQVRSRCMFIFILLCFCVFCLFVCFQNMPSEFHMSASVPCNHSTRLGHPQVELVRFDGIEISYTYVSSPVCFVFVAELGVCGADTRGFPPPTLVVKSWRTLPPPPPPPEQVKGTLTCVRTTRSIRAICCSRSSSCGAPSHRHPHVINRRITPARVMTTPFLSSAPGMPWPSR